MAMNGNNLGDEIVAAIEALGANPGKQAFWRAIGTTIVNHVKTNAQTSAVVASGIACSVDPGTHIGSTTATGTATGAAGSAIT